MKQGCSTKLLGLHGGFKTFAEMPELPAEFVSQIHETLGEHAHAFFASLNDEAPTSVLSNPWKARKHLIESTTTIPWCSYGRYLDERPSYIMDPLYHGGAYYPMEASSMMLWTVLSHLYPEHRPARVLDLCAAPGGKSQVISSYLAGKGLLVSNEVNRSRFNILRENLGRWGDPSICVSNQDPSRIPLTGFFDCVVVDAPCSGEGLFRKSPDATSEWSLSNVRHCSLRQRRILGEAVRLTSPGGIIIYSTCTYNPTENIENVQWLANEFGCRSVDLELGHNTEHVTDSEVHGYQCWPHRVRGEGFFVSALKKQEGYETKYTKTKSQKTRNIQIAPRRLREIWKDFCSVPITPLVNPKGQFTGIATEHLDPYLQAADKMTGLSPILTLGELKRESVVPHHTLALTTAISAELPAIDLDLEQAIRFLRKEVPDATPKHTGWNLVRYEGVAIGWVKYAGNKLKNYFPTNLRIRKR